MRMRALLASLAFLLAGCLAPPPVGLESDLGLRVFAGDESTANLVAGFADELAPRLRAELQDPGDEPLEIWVQEETRTKAWGPSWGHNAFYVPSDQRIHLATATVTGPPEMARLVLAHELVHAWHGATWSWLDGPLEEGLADTIALRVVPEAAARLRSQRLLALLPQGLDVELGFARGQPSVMSRIALMPSTSGAYDHRRALGSVALIDYGRAFLVVQHFEQQDRLAGLRQACLDADGEPLSLDEAARRAGLDLGEAALADWVPRHFDAEALRSALAEVAGDIGPQLARAFLAASPDPGALFDDLGMEFSVKGGTARVRGADVAGLREAFVHQRLKQTGKLPKGP
jgi:hypothetical protein